MSVIRTNTEYRYQCAHDHEWVSVPVDKMRCPACGTITLRRLKPAEGVEDAVAATLWAWNAEHSPGLHGFPYERLEEVTKEDLRRWPAASCPTFDATLRHSQTQSG